MKQEAEAHAAEDKKRREVIDLKNQADQLVYPMEKTLKEHGDKVPAEIRGNIESAINNLKEALKGDDATASARRSTTSTKRRRSWARRSTRRRPAGGRRAQAQPQTAAPAKPRQAQGRRRRHRRRVRSQVTGLVIDKPLTGRRRAPCPPSPDASS